MLTPLQFLHVVLLYMSITILIDDVCGEVKYYYMISYYATTYYLPVDMKPNDNICFHHMLGFLGYKDELLVEIGDFNFGGLR